MLDLLYYIISAILGGILGWLIGGNSKGSIRKLTEESARYKQTINEMATEIATFKDRTTQQLDEKSKEITKLKKGNALPDIITKAQEKEINHWKNKALELEKTIKTKTTTPASSIQNPELEKKLSQAQEEITLLKTEIKAKTKELKSIADKQPLEVDNSDLIHLQKRYKKLKKKYKKSQSSKVDKTSTKIITETLDVEKLAAIIASGELIKRSTKKKSS